MAHHRYLEQLAYKYMCSIVGNDMMDTHIHNGQCYVLATMSVMMNHLQGCKRVINFLGAIWLCVPDVITTYADAPTVCPM